MGSSSFSYFIAFFKRSRGYDITPWMPAEMQKKYNYWCHYIKNIFIVLYRVRTDKEVKYELKN